MIKDIITDEDELSVQCFNHYSDEKLLKIANDLVDTANEHKDRCLGLAANQIGYNARVFVIKTPAGYAPIINPEVVCMTGGRKQYLEACLSRLDKEPIRVKRYKRIKIKITRDGEQALLEFTGLAARVVQHELDHLNGILI